LNSNECDDSIFQAFVEPFAIIVGAGVRVTINVLCSDNEVMILLLLKRERCDMINTEQSWRRSRECIDNFTINFYPPIDFELCTSNIDSSGLINMSLSSQTEHLAAFSVT
jgi:hypothetical protein